MPSRKRSKKNYYAVVTGRNPGIYQTWDECKAQTDGFPNSRFKGFESLTDAKVFMVTNGGNSTHRLSSIKTPPTPPTNDTMGSACFPICVNETSTVTNVFINGHSNSIDQKNYNASLNKGASLEKSTKSVHSTETKALRWHETLFVKENSHNVINADSNTNCYVKTCGSENDSIKDDMNHSIETGHLEREKKSKLSSEPDYLSCYSITALNIMKKMGYKDGQGLTASSISIPIDAKGTPGYPNHSFGLGYEKEEILNENQSKAVELAKSGCNVFITGPAGTGKSVVLRHIIKFFKSKYGVDGRHHFVVVGPTGPTALSLGGQTIHSFAGCGVPVKADDFEKCWNKLNRIKWRKLELMIVDEVSMISGEFFDRLSDVVSRIRGNHRPFGGIQLILCGDFLQLPPIPRKSYAVLEMTDALRHQGKEHVEIHGDRGYAFQARSWKNAALSFVELKEVFRQKNNTFVSILHEIRRGEVSTRALSFLKQCQRALATHQGIEPTILYATNKNVTMENMTKLSRLPGDIHYFQAEDDIKIDPDAPSWAAERLRNNRFFYDCIAEKKLGLKVGAQVMLIKNEAPDVRNRKVNGSRGKVVGFVNAPVNEKTDDILSPKCASIDNSQDHRDVYPVVRFLDNSERIIHPNEFESELVGLGKCIRKAIPLKLAWAVTMHKSQGLTLDFVKVDVTGVFAEGQTYVALSRASDENGLELRSFSRESVKVDKRALAFYADPSGNFPCWDEYWG